MVTNLIIFLISVFIIALIIKKTVKRNKVIYGDKNYKAPIITDEEIEECFK